MSAPFRELHCRTLRANPAYELVLLDRLTENERQGLGALAWESDLYGVLQPRGAAGLGAKTVDRETALLFLTLREPGPLPGYVRSFGEEGLQRVALLIADGVLEIAAGEAFVSGAPALQALRGYGGEAGGRGAAGGGVAEGISAQTAELGEGRLAALSQAALRYGQALALDDPLLLSARLYGFNGRPLTPRWRRLLPDAAGVERFLGIDDGGAFRAVLDRRWRRSDASAAPSRRAVPSPRAAAPAEETADARTGWLSFRSRARVPPLAGERPTYKLYVSPQPEVLGTRFGEIVEALGRARAAQFKVGRDAWGLLRPDKIVAYFASFELLGGACDELSRRLAVAPAQGVPFTSEIAGDGLLSWGIDPPAAERSTPWSGRESWRLWLTHRLARALIAARAAHARSGSTAPAEPDAARAGRTRRGHRISNRQTAAAGAAAEAGTALEPWQFALERLRLEGVDTNTWTPGALLWRNG
ncbi:MAG TPA: hypothetical protein VHR45_05910 [Thermoanaerobaculia bacterium]|nr:hypothetical protein [Thermoanaerobaculia bacterium]